MKKITTSFLLPLLVVFFFVACSSDSSNDDSSSAGDSTHDYWPTAMDNNWIFNQDGKEITMKIIGIDDIGGAKYYKFNQMVGADTSLGVQASVSIKKDKGDYYIKMGEINVTNSGYTGKITGYEFLFFKDYLEVNQTWSGKYTSTTTYDIPNFPGIVTSVNYSGKILERGSVLTINGKTYKDVIKFTLTQIASISGQGSSESVATYCIAKDVGLLKMESNGSLTQLKSYVLK